MTALELIAAVMASNMPDAAKLETVQRLAGSEPQRFPVFIPYPTYQPPRLPGTLPDYYPTWTTGGTGGNAEVWIPQHNYAGPVTVRLQ